MVPLRAGISLYFGGGNFLPVLTKAGQPRGVTLISDAIETVSINQGPPIETAMASIRGPELNPEAEPSSRNKIEQEMPANADK